MPRRRSSFVPERPPAKPADLEPKGSTRRRNQVRAVARALQRADLPNAYVEFEAWAAVLREETNEGRRIQERWRNYIAQGGRVPGVNNPDLTCQPAIFLPLLIAELASQESAPWRRAKAVFHSPKQELAEYAPDPARRAALEQEIEREQAEARAVLIGELDGSTLLAQICTALAAEESKPRKRDAKERQRRANRDQDRTPPSPEICLWSKPMTVREYVAATAMNRKTVERFLADIKAKPARVGRHAAEGARYSVSVNLRVLARWIGVWTRDPDQARGLAAATAAYTRVHDGDFVRRLLSAFWPALKRRGLIGPPAANAKFVEDLDAHLRLYSPPPRPRLASEMLASGILDFGLPAA